MTFPKGRSGNPAGRERGSKNLVTRALASVSEADAEAIIRKGLELAREGNPTLLKWCLHHIAPAQTSRPTHFNAPPIQDIPDIDPAVAAVNAAFFFSRDHARGAQSRRKSPSDHARHTRTPCLEGRGRS